MKILQISSAPISYIGGAEKVVLDLSKELSKKHEVTILQTNLYEENKKFQKITNLGKIKIITCKNDRFLGGFGYSKEFKRILRKIWKNFDVIHVHGHGRFTSDFTLRYIGKKKPIIYTAHGFFHSLKSGKTKKLYNKWFKKIKNKVKFFTALTELEEKQYLKLGVKKNKIKIIPNGIELKEFSKAKNKSFLKKIGIQNNLKNVLFVGRIHESKGIHYLVKSIKNIKVNLIIAGRDAGFKEKIIELINKEGLKKKVFILENLDNNEIKKLYGSCDLFVLFSEWEGFGIVVLEAMASGLPVITSDKGALPYLVKNKENGLVVEYPNIKKLEKSIEYLLTNNSERQKLGRDAKKFSKKFNREKIVKEYLQLYKRCIKK